MELDAGITEKYGSNGRIPWNWKPKTSKTRPDRTDTIDPATGELAGPDIASQTRKILDAFGVMLASAGSGLTHVFHINVFLADMDDFAAMNQVYAGKMGITVRPEPRLR